MADRLPSPAKSLLVLIALTVATTAASAQNPYQQTWNISEWLNRRDYADSVVTDDAGDVYVGGRTGEIYGTPAVGEKGLRVAKYDPSGNRLWLEAPYPARGLDHCSGLAIDSASNLYLAGETYRFPGGAEAFLVKYDSAGNLQWDRHLGTTDNEFGFDVATDTFGNAYVTGSTTGVLAPGGDGNYDAFLAKYDTNGNLLWTKQFDDSVGNYGFTVSVAPSGHVYMAGQTGHDARFTKLDSDGNLIWTQSPNFSVDPAQHTAFWEMTTDSDGNVYVCGDTDKIYDSAYGYQSGDAVVAKFDADGNLQWQRQLESATQSETESFSGVTVDEHGNVFLSGLTAGAVQGANAGGSDAVWAKYDSDGNLVWVDQFGTANDDYARGIAVDSLGRVYVTGATQWEINNYYHGESDVFLARYDEIPEPATMSLLGLGALAIIKRRRRC